MASFDTCIGRADEQRLALVDVVAMAEDFEERFARDFAVVVAVAAVETSLPDDFGYLSFVVEALPAMWARNYSTALGLTIHPVIDEFDLRYFLY